MMRGVTATARALLAEVVGTLFFISIGAGAIVADASGGGSGLVGIALAHGLALAIAVSIFGPTSGGHFNPAVSLALALGGAFRCVVLGLQHRKRSRARPSGKVAPVEDREAA
jgi:glycerol uptake facilitator-like aquaporin